MIANTIRSASQPPWTRRVADGKRMWVRWIGGGGYSRMLDMGGAPSATNDPSMFRAANVSKNSKLQAVAFEFEILTNSLDQAKAIEATASTTTTAEEHRYIPHVSADLDQIHQVASLLNVSVDAGKEKDVNQKKGLTAHKSICGKSDVRAKYASKLQGGLAGLELAKQQVDDRLKGGDAAGHLAARKMAVSETAASPSKWMALTGTGKLLSYLTHRSIRIALLPNPRLDVSQRDVQYDMMQQFQKQLRDVVVDTLVSLDGESGGACTTSSVLERALETQVLKHLDIHPNKILVVSDKDDYLKVAKDLGMLTCRLQLPNTRRGNVTAHYNTQTVPDVQEVVNEINGISFNAVLNR